LRKLNISDINISNFGIDLDFFPFFNRKLSYSLLSSYIEGDNTGRGDIEKRAIKENCEGEGD
jgi:hypothetical protein